MKLITSWQERFAEIWVLKKYRVKMKHEILIYNQTKQKIPKKLIKAIILRSLQFLKLKRPVELAVLIVSAKVIKKLNRIWRHEKYTPDELSFGLNNRQKGKLAKSKNKVLELGEIVVNVDKIVDKNKFSEILVHSLLHLLGYNHEKSKIRAEKIEILEEKMLKYLNI